MIERQPDESVTAFTIRRIRAEIIEECARVADDHTPAKHNGTLAAHVTGSTIARAIRGLAQAPAKRETEA